MRHVYVAADANGRHKIGVTTNPRKRCGELSRDIGGVRVEIIHVEPHGQASFEVEKRAHNTLASHHDGGEWFNVSRETALAAVELAKLALRNPPPPSLPPPQTHRPPTHPKPSKATARPVGRPPMLTDGKLVALKADGALWDKVDAWAARQSPTITSRSAAIRAMIERVLKEDEGR
jgi:hypothetical protein